VSQTIIDRTLLTQAANQSGVSADAAAVQRQLDEYENRYSKQAHWQENRAAILPGLRAALEEEDVLRRFEVQVRKVSEPAEAQVREYYQQHPELFTTPEQVRLSMILLKVAPSSTSQVWQAARDEAEKVLQRLRKGSDFYSMARIHSGDATAAKGGDMGFLHKGMLAAPAQSVIDGMQAGDLSDPVNLLSGIAVFRLEERKEANLNAFATVAERAKKLLMRENSEAAWKGVLQRLRSTVTVSINKAAL
jgi:peptidyl-prolyl cis-trans isomerase C